MLTILTEVGVESQNPTNTLDLFGAGKQKASGRVNLVLKDLKVAIRWSFASVRGVWRSGGRVELVVVTRRPG